MRIAVYPGSFDPITYGHLDIIERSAKICDKLIVAVLVNSTKTPTFSLEERVELIKTSVGDARNIEIESFSGLLIDYMKQKDANIIIKGLRAFSDFEYEFQMALMNKTLCPEVETLFMMTSSRYSYVSSSMVKELVRYDGDIDEFVPQLIKGKITDKFKERKV